MATNLQDENFAKADAAVAQNAANLKPSLYTPGSNPKIGGAVTRSGQIDNVLGRTTPPARVNPDSIVPTTSSDSSNPSNEDTFAKYEAGLALTPAETSAISDRLTTYAQSQTDLINAQFAEKAARQKDQNTAEDSRTRVLNSKSGNIDSGTGSAALEITQKKGKEALDALDTERAAKVSTVLGQIDTMKENEIKAATAQKANDLKSYNDLLTKNRTASLDSTKTLASSATSLDQLKTAKNSDGTSVYDTLVKNSGLSPLEYDAKFNSFKDAAHQIKYTYKAVGDKLIAYGADPVTGKMVENEMDIPGIGGGKYTFHETKDGRIFKQDANTGDITQLTTSSTTDTPDNNYTIPPASKNSLAKISPLFTPVVLTQIEKDIRKFGIQKVIDGQTDATIKAALTKVLNPTGGSTYDPTK